MEIELVIFDADNTLIDFPKCEKEALKYVFAYANLALTDHAVNLFSKIDNKLWTEGHWENKLIDTKDIPFRRFEILFELLNIEKKILIYLIKYIWRCFQK